MTREIVARARAIEDLSQQVEFYKREVSVEAAQRLYKAAVQTFVKLSEQPGMGTLTECAAVPDLRRWRVQGFESLLIFYRYDERHLYLIRLLHGARDLNNLLDDEREFRD